MSLRHPQFVPQLWTTCARSPWSSHRILSTPMHEPRPGGSGTLATVPDVFHRDPRLPILTTESGTRRASRAVGRPRAAVGRSTRGGVFAADPGRALALARRVRPRIARPWVLSTHPSV